MSFLSHTKTIPAIDISSTEVKIALVTSDRKVQYAVSTPLPSGAFHHTTIVDPVPISEAIVGMRTSITPSLGEVVCTIPDTQCFTYLIQIPRSVHEHDIRSAITTEAEKIIPIEQKDMYWGYIDNDSLSDTNTRAYVYVGVPRHVVKSYQTVIERSGLTMVGIDMKGFALGRVLLPRENAPAPHGTLIVSGDGDTAAIVVCDARQRFVFSSTLAVASDTEVSSIVTEIQKTLSYATTTLHQNIGAIILAGDLASVSGIQETIATGVGIPVEIGDLSRTVSKLKAVSTKDDPLVYASALGSSLMYTEHPITGKPLNIVLEQDIFSPKSKKTEDRTLSRVENTPVNTPSSKKALAYVFIVGAFVVLGFIIYFYILKPFM